MRVAIYTSIAGGFDYLPDPAPQSIDCDFFCFTDYPHLFHPGGRPTTAWNIIPIPIETTHPRMVAKYYKLMSHEVFPDGYLDPKYRQLLTYLLEDHRYDYTIWVDGGVYIHNPGFTEHMISSVGDTDWAMYRQPERDCVYEEFNASTAIKYQTIPIKEQMDHYSKYGLPHHGGLPACTFIARRSPEPIHLRMINNLWWEENKRWSYADQLSLPWILYTLRLGWDEIPGILYGGWNSDQWFRRMFRPPSSEEVWFDYRPDDVKIANRIVQLDLSLFDKVSALTEYPDGDHHSWLAIQRVIRRRAGGYIYLEIGSYVGGSLQQHLVDPDCHKIYSIDKRPLECPDDRDGGVATCLRSTADMLNMLCNAFGDGPLRKLECFDSDSRDIDLSRIVECPDICFIDGEHTQAAIYSDFEFCLKVCKPNGIIYVHDDDFLYPAIRKIMGLLDDLQIPYTPLKLGGVTFAFCLRDCEVANDATIRQLALDGRKWLRSHTDGE